MTGVLPTVLLALACAACATGCAGGGAMRCGDPARYAGSGSAPPVRVPGDLSVPDESQALQIPSGDPLPVRGEDDPPECLEAPPDFFGENPTESRG